MELRLQPDGVDVCRQLGDEVALIEHRRAKSERKAAKVIYGLQYQHAPLFDGPLFR